MGVQSENILIVSDKNDLTTTIVCKYLTFKSANFTVITTEDMKISDFNFFFKKIENAKSIWLRRGDFPVENTTKQLIFEFLTLRNYIHFLAESNKNCIGNLRSEYNHNKFIDLKIAQRNGLMTPLSFIITNKEQFEDLRQISANKSYITKSLKNCITKIIDAKLFHFGFTIEILNDKLKKINYDFFPSLVQEKIEKEFEIRSFYLKGKMYSMAIFSQNNEKTKLDYRNYDLKKQNRQIPFQLPAEIEDKIKKFMKEINLNCGSIDIIYGKDGNYYFLEVNPVGHFGWLSFNCNYFLEEIIANELINQDLYEDGI